ncbi:MAG: VWA domain-containing protein [Kiritimatiellae bacterium]|nr:VWA domain-containing protein [Kiritimatiellia bacterium]
MELRYPAALALLLLVPVLVRWKYGRRTQGAAFSDVASLAGVPRSWASLCRHLLPLAYALALGALVVALARPRAPLAAAVSRQPVVDIMLAVDVSGSMKTEDFLRGETRISRLNAAVGVLRDFIAARREDRIGVVVFAAFPYTLAPLTLDHDWLSAQLERLAPDMLPYDSTAIGSALGCAVNRLRRSEATSKVVILLSDGRNNAGQLSPQDAAQAARALGVRVHTVGIATAPADSDSLWSLAQVAGGRHFEAADLAALRGVYRELDRMERTDVDVRRYTRYEERFGWFAALAVLLLVAEKGLSFSRLGVLP